jgi:hypothetical protein
VDAGARSPSEATSASAATIRFVPRPPRSLPSADSVVAKKAENPPSCDPPPAGSAVIHSAPGLPPGDYIVTDSRPGIVDGSILTTYQQMHLGYPVEHFGYSISTKDCTVLSQGGTLMKGLPNQYPTPISRDAALKIVLRASNHEGPAPWLAEPKKYHAPTGGLTLQGSESHPTPRDFALIWRFNLRNSGLPALSAIINASTGKVLWLQPPYVE